MNKINPIFEALSNVDDRHIPVAREKKPVIKPKIILVAAVAAAFAVAGFTTSTVRKHLFGFYGEGVTGHSFEFKLTSHEITVPEEFMPNLDEHHLSDGTDIPPSKLFEMFGLKSPVNDNFTEVKDKLTYLDVGIFDDPNKPHVRFEYTLFNKSINQNVLFEARYYSETDNMTLTAREGLLPNEPNEVITLKDGTLCMITKSKAVFSYDGAEFRFEIDYDFEVPANIGEMTEAEQYQVVDEMIEAMPGMDAVKQVLADLDLL